MDDLQNPPRTARDRLLNAAAELTAETASRQAVRRHKEEVEAILAEQLGVLLPEDLERATTLASHLTLLVEGAMARAGLEGNSARVLEGRAIAEEMLEGL